MIRAGSTTCGREPGKRRVKPSGGGCLVCRVNDCYRDILAVEILFSWSTFVFVVNHNGIRYRTRIKLVVHMIELPCMREKGTAESSDRNTRQWLCCVFTCTRACS
jgi:hypothetical protein